jgi:translation initiation factor 2 beta subunit (eIF-2beta)/eIF-5
MMTCSTCGKPITTVLYRNSVTYIHTDKRADTHPAQPRRANQKVGDTSPSERA